MKFVPANTLSRLIIDADKDWDEKNISNLNSGKINLGINQPLSPGLTIEDIGKSWHDIGVITSGAGADLYANVLIYAGSGLSYLGAGNKKVYKSTDYGLNWSVLTLTASSYIHAMTSCSGGILLAGDAGGHIYRSTDYGNNWTDLGAISSGQILDMTYLGNGIVLLCDVNEHIFRSTDYGATWTDLGSLASSGAYSIVYCDNGIALFGDNNGHIFRSIDNGANWADLGVIAGRIRCMTYCGNGVVLLGDFDLHVFRSEDYGATWTDLDTVGASAIRSMTYCGNGIVLLGNNAMHAFRSSDFGETWTDLGAVVSEAGGLLSMVYCGNGVSLLGNVAGHVYRSGTAFKSSDASVQAAIDCVEKPVNVMTFWSDVDALVTLPADTALPNIVIADIPSNPTVIRAILILKYSAKKDTSGGDNQITAGKITSKETTGGTYVDAINLINGEAKVTASTKEGGDVHAGDNDISGSTSDITDNCTVQSVFNGVTTTGASIELYDVQVGIIIYFT